MSTSEWSRVPGACATGAAGEILSDEAVAFVVDLQRRFGARRRDLLAAREARQTRIDAGERPDFLADTASVRDADWRCAPIPQDLLDRRVEITGPVERKMVINALNSGARVFMADFEDSTTPTWANLLEGQANLRDAVRRTIAYTDRQDRQGVRPESGDRRAVRPHARLAPGRGAHAGRR